MKKSYKQPKDVITTSGAGSTVPTGPKETPIS